MRDALDVLGALAAKLGHAPVSRELHERGRQRLLARAAQLPQGAPRSWRRPAVAWVSAAAAAALILVWVGFVYRRPIGYEVVGGTELSSDYLSASAARPAQVKFTDGSELNAAPNTRLRIDRKHTQGARIIVERGSATASVKHERRSDWQFVAGPFEVRVTGTKLTLAWDPLKEEVDLVLHEGSVEVLSPLAPGRFAVRAGQSFHASLADGSMRFSEGSRATGSALPSAAAESEKSAAALEDADGARRATDSGGRAADDERDAPAASRSTWVETRSRESAAAPAAARSAAPAGSSSLGASRTSSSSASWPELVRSGQFSAVVAAAEQRGVEACLNACSAQELRALADAARYSAKGDLSEQSLLSLRRRFAGTEAAPAAFLLGRLNESRRKFSAADRWYDTYLRESPQGQFASDALAGRMRLASGLNGPAAAKPLANEYLRRYPDGVHAPTARKLSGRE